MQLGYAGLRVIVIGLVVATLAGCGAIYDMIDPPPPDERITLRFYVGQAQYAESLVLRTARGGEPKVYTEQVPILTAANIKMAVPMKDAKGYFFVGIRLDEKGSRVLAQASSRAVGKTLVLIVDEKLVTASPIDSPITEGTFAIAMPDRASTFALASLLNPREP